MCIKRQEAGKSRGKIRGEKASSLIAKRLRHDVHDLLLDIHTHTRATCTHTHLQAWTWKSTAGDARMQYQVKG